MNIQMPSLRDVTPNGDASPTTVSSATDRQEGEEIEPEDGHEVPVEGGRLERSHGQQPCHQPALYVDEPAHTAQHMRCVQHCEHVEERAARTCRQEIGRAHV